jgi:putative molybdopterin biosynthesis protein
MGNSGKHSVLRSARIERGLTQAELARQADISRQALSAIEAGIYQPTVGVALRLSRALGMTVEQLFGDDFGGKFERLAAVVLDPQEEPYDAHRPASRRALYLARVGGQIVAATRPPVNLKLVPAAGVIERFSAHGTKADVLAFRSPAEIDATALIAGCDPAGVLLEEYVARLSIKVRAVYLECSSLAALRTLRAGMVHGAGVHLRNRSVENPLTASSPASDFNLDAVCQALEEEPFVMVHFARWELGLAVCTANPLGIHGPADVARPGVRLALREPGSGARQALEQALAESGLELSRCIKTGLEVRSHLEAAAAVAQGRADAAATLRIAAESFGLDFIPLRNERYDLVITKRAIGETAVRAIMDALNSSRFAREVSSLCGYDTSAMGSVVERP